jgi:hypothetical protein
MKTSTSGASSSTLRSSLRTVEAARYLGISASLLRKLRMRAPDDPGRRGPNFVRLSPQLIVYRIEDLDAWLDVHAVRIERAA